MAQLEQRRPALEALLKMEDAWNHTLPHELLRRGFVYSGALSRMRRVVHDLSSGRPAKIVAIGGSITAGNSGISSGSLGWLARLERWLQRVFPGTATVQNAAQGGTMHSFFSMCLESTIDSNADVLFAEFTLNDNTLDGDNSEVPDCAPGGRTWEQLIRRTLALPRAPAMVLMQVPVHNLALDYEGNGEAGVARRFQQTHEDAMGAFAQYYDLPWLSFRSSTWYPAKVDPQLMAGSNLSYAHLMNPDDHVHPSALGHKVMADLAVFMFQATALDLVLRPFGSSPYEQHFASTLPAKPMCNRNVVPEASTCFTAPKLEPLITHREGFEWAVEGTPKNPKPGYVATKPGSRIRFVVDTRRSTEGWVGVTIGLLKSYEHMGVAGLSCTSGCTCAPLAVDGTWADKVSQTYLARLEASQAERCEVQVEVLPATTSGEHKVKVTGIIVALSPNWAYEYELNSFLDTKQ